MGGSETAPAALHDTTGRAARSGRAQCWGATLQEDGGIMGWVKKPC